MKKRSPAYNKRIIKKQRYDLKIGDHVEYLGIMCEDTDVWIIAGEPFFDKDMNEWYVKAHPAYGTSGDATQPISLRRIFV